MISATTPASQKSCAVIMVVVVMGDQFLCYFRDYVRKALVYMTVGKSSETVRYHRVSSALYSKLVV